MKKNIKNYLIIIAIILLIILSATLYFMFILNNDLLATLRKTDISLQPSTICKKNIPGNVWLISYASGGDGYLANQKHQTKTGLNNCIDFFKPYSLKHIDPSYIEAHKNIFSQKRGAGYWLWKPYLIMKTLEEIPENDIVVYLDSSINIIKPLDSLINKLEKHDIIFFELDHKNKSWVKRDLLRIMNSDNEKMRNEWQLQGGYVIIKNTKCSRDFIKKWLNICENEVALTDLPSKDEYPEFKDHRHDQSILSVLYRSNPDKRILVLPFTESSYGNTDKEFYIHRRANIKDYSLIFNTCGIWIENEKEALMQYLLIEKPISEIFKIFFVHQRNKIIHSIKSSF